MATALGALGRRDVNARRALIAEGLWIRAAIAAVVHDAPATRAPGGPMAPYVTDVRGTMVSSDEHIEQLVKWIDAPDHATRPAPVYRPRCASLGWWLWNPGGKLLLDARASSSLR